ncbi:MAG: dTMP kinase [Bacilli bacterium]|jgi:dTMP kinase|nr:dTMP kinase [Bacilli bacterium]
MDKRLFITFEGPDGSGKTTIIKMVAKYLKNNNIDFVLTREPGGSLIAEQIRNIILNPNNLELSSTTEALLYAASRAQHFNEVIEPALMNNKLVLCDRFIDSSLAYQGVARGLGIDEVMEINRFAIKDVLPDLTIFFDLDPIIGLNRINNSEFREINRLDLEEKAFHYQVYEGYLKIVKMYQKRFKVVDAHKPIEEVYNNVINIIMEQLNR